MMKVVVPLAGPDFDLPDGSVKAQIQISGGALLQTALASRPWANQLKPTDYVFVLKDTPSSRAFGDGDLKAWYPNARCVWLSNYTTGAALSALAGVALLDASDDPIIIDLADILFKMNCNPASTFLSDPTLGAILPIFSSNSPLYSYATLDANGWVVATAEKIVISEHASAGAYLFRNRAVYLEAVAHNLQHAEEVTHSSLFFVCPLMNGVISGGRRVLAQPVEDVVDIKI